LKEKIRGSSSGIEVPQLRQKNFSLKTRTSPRLPALGPLKTTDVPPNSSATRPGMAGSAEDSFLINSTSSNPSASAEAASSDSARRFRSPSFITRRSTTIEISCMNFLSSSIPPSSSRRRSSPSITARA